MPHRGNPDLKLIIRGMLRHSFSDGGVNYQPLTIHFVDGFFFGASLVPGFELKLFEEPI
jgi:hypothetical protein